MRISGLPVCFVYNANYASLFWYKLFIHVPPFEFSVLFTPFLMFGGINLARFLGNCPPTPPLSQH